MRTFGIDYLRYLETACDLDYLFADPPWKYDDRPPKMRGQTGFTLWADNEAGTREIFQNCQRLKVDLVWMWVPVSLLNVPMSIFQHYGYRYKTTAVWRKLTRNLKEFYGCGYWLRNSVEFLLLFVRLFTKRPPMRSDRRNLWSCLASEENTAKPRQMELDIMLTMKSRYGADTKGAYLFSGKDVACFSDLNLDCVDAVLRDTEGANDH